MVSADFVPAEIRFAAVLVGSGASSLQHEVGDHPVKGASGKVAAGGHGDKPGHVGRGPVGIEGKLDHSAIVHLDTGPAHGPECLGRGDGGLGEEARSRPSRPPGPLVENPGRLPRHHRVEVGEPGGEPGGICRGAELLDAREEGHPWITRGFRPLSRQSRQGLEEGIEQVRSPWRLAQKACCGEKELAIAPAQLIDKDLIGGVTLESDEATDRGLSHVVFRINGEPLQDVNGPESGGGAGGVHPNPPDVALHEPGQGAPGSPGVHESQRPEGMHRSMPRRGGQRFRGDRGQGLPDTRVGRAKLPEQVDCEELQVTGRVSECHPHRRASFDGLEMRAVSRQRLVPDGKILVLETLPQQGLVRFGE